MTNTSPGDEKASRPAPHGPPPCPHPAQALTLGMGPVGNAQGSWVGVNAIGDHSIEYVAAGGQPVTGQEPHDARVPVVELGRARMEKLSDSRSPQPTPWELGQHSQAAWH